MIIDFIQNLKSSVKIHLKLQWVANLKERYSENMQQIYRRRPMPKRDFSMAVLL